MQKLPKADKSSKNPFVILLLISIVLNIYAWQHLSKPPREVLASVGTEKLLLDGFDRQTQIFLRRKAEEWAQNQILTKEAALRSTTPAELLGKEVYNKVTVDPQAVFKRYVLSPDADKIGWPQISKQIETLIRAQRGARLRNDFLRSLYPKYQVQIFMKEAANADEGLNWKMVGFPPYHAPPAVTTLSADGSVTAPPFKGPAQAPVVLEFYSDFMCPYSHRFYEPLKQLSAMYPDKLRIVFRHFPLPMHEGSHLMSEASICAQEQGKFWEFYDKVMSGEAGKKDKDALMALAGELGLEMPKFRGCLDSEKYKVHVDQEITLGKSIGVQGTPSFFVNGRLSVGALPAEAVKPLIDWYLNPQGPYPGQKPSAPSGPQPGANQPPAIDPKRVYAFDEKWVLMGPLQGPQNAPVTLVEFLDSNCPFCRRGSDTVSELVKRYPGKIRVVAKQFPLPMHPNAMKTSEALMCADLQGKFWDYRKEVFGDSWGKNTPEDLKAIAKKVGLKEKDFDACLDTDKTKERITHDIQVGSAAGVQGTPGYFLNGRFINGAQPVESFEAVLKEVLPSGDQQVYA